MVIVTAILAMSLMDERPSGLLMEPPQSRTQSMLDQVERRSRRRARDAEYDKAEAQRAEEENRRVEEEARRQAALETAANARVQAGTPVQSPMTPAPAQASPNSQAATPSQSTPSSSEPKDEDPEEAEDPT